MKYLSRTDPLAIKGQPINIVKDFKNQVSQTQVNIKVTEGQNQLKDPFI